MQSLDGFIAVDHGHPRSNGESHISIQLKLALVAAGEHHPHADAQVHDGYQSADPSEDAPQVTMICEEPLPNLVGEWTSMEQADTEARNANKVWQLHQDVRNARRRGDHSAKCDGELRDFLIDTCYRRLAEAAQTTEPKVTSRADVQKTRIQQDGLYAKCCDEFFGGTRNPLSKSVAFLAAFREVQLIMERD